MKKYDRPTARTVEVHRQNDAYAWELVGVFRWVNGQLSGSICATSAQMPDEVRFRLATDVAESDRDGLDSGIIWFDGKRYRWVLR